VGGNFRQISEKIQPYLAALSGTYYYNREVVDPKVEASAGSHKSALLRVEMSSPLRQEAVIRFALPAAGAVRLAVFDVTGRKVVSLIDQLAMGAGSHEVKLDTARMAPGVYFVRLESGRGRATGKLLLR
jgi:hypothetical protein